MQATPDMVTIFKDFGLGLVLIVIVAWAGYKTLIFLVSYVISKVFSKFVDDHNKAVGQIDDITSSLVELQKEIDKITEELNSTCKMETCPYLDEISDLLKEIHKTIFQFTEEAKDARADTKERISAIHENLRDVSQSLLGLIKTFIDKEVNRSHDDKRSV